MRKAEISIIIPARNEASGIGKCLEAVMAQECRETFEIIVIDSGSTDETVAVASRFPKVRLIQIAAEEFGHGNTRNLGAGEAKSDILVFLNADAVPRGKNWLSALTGEFAGGERIAGVFSRHVPRPDCHLYMARDLERSMPGSRIEKTEAGRLEFSVFSTVSAAVRRDIWQVHPFRDGILIAEDQEWAGRVLKEGYKLVYAPESIVVHSHNYSFGEMFRVKYRVGRVLNPFPNRFFALTAGIFLAAGAGVWKLAGDFFYIVKQSRPVSKKIREMNVALKARFAGFAGRYAGWVKGPERIQ